MKLSAALIAFTFAVPATFAAQATLSYDTIYDNRSGSLTSVACSDGSNGLITKGYKTFGELKQFPNIGGAAAVAGWNSKSCGTCWKLTYKGNSINVLAIDHADSGYNIALAAMNKLTNGQGVALGRITVDAVSVAASNCGL